MTWREWWRELFTDTRPRYKYEHHPSTHHEGKWLVFKRLFEDYWMFVTSRSSERSAQVYIEEREAKCKRRN